MTIGLIGAENSHARHFCEVINKQKKWTDVQIKYIYGGDDPAACGKLCEEYGIADCATDDEVIAKSDAVVITYRRGSQHCAPAIKAIQAGKPLFNDKPFATSAAEAQEIAALAERLGVPVTGGTSLKTLPELAEIKRLVRPGSLVVISYAADPESPYDGYWFYAIHSAEICAFLCGEDFTSVGAFKNYASAVISNVTYADRRCVIATSKDSWELVITVSNGAETVTRKVNIAAASIVDEFIEMVRTGKPPRGYSHYVRSVELLGKIVESAGL